MLGDLSLSELVAPFIDPETHLRDAARGPANGAATLRAVDSQR
jgi:hypothetical protein